MAPTFRSEWNWGRINKPARPGPVRPRGSIIAGLENAFLVFALTLVAATLLSEAAGRSLLSATVLFLAAGFIAAAFGWVSIGPRSSIVSGFAELALVIVLFTDGMKLSIVGLALERGGLLALAAGMPMTILLATFSARFLVTTSWTNAALLAAILSPTDPVIAAAIVNRTSVPARARSLLNVESGLNDGLALPVVMVLIEIAGPKDVHAVRLAAELLAGAAIGLILPPIYFRAEQFGLFGVMRRKQALAVVAVPLAVFGVALRAGTNVFLAMFFAGASVRTWACGLQSSAEQVGDVLADLARLAAVFVFAAAVSFSVVRGLGFGDYLFVALMIVLVRPLAFAPMFPLLRLTLSEWAVVAWFGPRGFSSLIYAILLLSSQVAGSEQLFHVAALVIVVSMAAYSSTAAPVAGWLARQGHHQRQLR